MTAITDRAMRMRINPSTSDSSLLRKLQLGRRDDVNCSAWLDPDHLEEGLQVRVWFPVTSGDDAPFEGKIIRFRGGEKVRIGNWADDPRAKALNFDLHSGHWEWDVMPLDGETTDIADARSLTGHAGQPPAPRAGASPGRAGRTAARTRPASTNPNRGSYEGDRRGDASRRKTIERGSEGGQQPWRI